MEKCDILLQIEKAAESSDGDRTGHVFSIGKAVARFKSNFITPR